MGYPQDPQVIELGASAVDVRLSDGNSQVPAALADLVVDRTAIPPGRTLAAADRKPLVIRAAANVVGAQHGDHVGAGPYGGHNRALEIIGQRKPVGRVCAAA